MVVGGDKNMQAVVFIFRSFPKRYGKKANR